MSIQAEYDTAAASLAPLPTLRRSSCGGLHVRVAGARITLRASGAAWLIDSRTLVVADLHLEKGSAYGVRGQMLPPYDSRDTLMRLRQEIDLTNPDTVVLLGDSFHDRAAEERLSPEDAASIIGMAHGRRLVWVVGNHDADGPRALPGDVVASHTIEGLTLVHEPSGPPARGELSGHLHPAAKVAAFARGVRSRCFITDGERMILPAFGAYAGGLNVRDRAFDGLFTRRPHACALGRGRVHALKWNTLLAD